MTSNMKTKKTVKMWAVVQLDLQAGMPFAKVFNPVLASFSEAIYASEDYAQNYAGLFKELRLKVLPVTITYSLPTLPKKGRGKK